MATMTLTEILVSEKEKVVVGLGNRAGVCRELAECARQTLDIEWLGEIFDAKAEGLEKKEKLLEKIPTSRCN